VGVEPLQTDVALEAERDGASALDLRPFLVALSGVGALVVVAQRLWVAQGEPLWLDETWTAAIVSTPDWRSFWREAWLDVNAPAYYLVMRLWTSVFGVSNLALKLPGIMAVAAAAAVPLALRARGLSREACVAWAALLFFWWRVDFFLDARCYGLLLAVSTLQCVLFARLLTTPSRRRALAWCATAALAILTQYYAILVFAAQGLVFLAVHRGRALRCWPAGLALLPAAGWIAWHAPRIAAYADPSLAWHPAVDAAQALSCAGFTISPAGAAVVGAIGLVLAAGAAVPRLLRRPERDEAPEPAAALWWTAAAAAAAVVIALALGVWRESLTARYLIPATPSILLGIVLCARASRRAHMAYLGLAAIYLAAAIHPAVAAAARPDRSVYGSQTASELLMRQGVGDVVFIWDHEAARIIDPESLRRVGSVFFRRQGYPATVTPLVVRPDSDVSRMALSAARGARPGIIWLFNRAGRTAFALQAPQIAELDPRWTCRELSDGVVGALACYRRDGPEPLSLRPRV
jgi:hypothetical protein